MKPVSQKAKIVGVVTETRGLRKFSRLVPGRHFADMIELRLDRIPLRSHGTCLKIAQKLENSGIPVIATVRLKSEGGKWDKRDSSRLQLFKTALKTVSYADIELQSKLVRKIIKHAHSRGKKVIVSHHDFLKTPSLDNLLKIVDQAIKVGANIVKIAAMLKGEGDARALRALLRKGQEITGFRGLCVIAMGKLGQPLRVTLPALGSSLAYGFLDLPTAPGQLSCRQLHRALCR